MSFFGVILDIILFYKKKKEVFTRLFVSFLEW